MSNRALPCFCKKARQFKLHYDTKLPCTTAHCRAKKNFTHTKIIQKLQILQKKLLQKTEKNRKEKEYHSFILVFSSFLLLLFQALLPKSISEQNLALKEFSVSSSTIQTGERSWEESGERIQSRQDSAQIWIWGEELGRVTARKKKR